MNLKNEKGSITVFVLIALLFMSAFLIISYTSNVNKSKVVREQLEIIESIYKMKIETTDNIYNKATAVPTIRDLPEIIYIGVNSIEEYIDSGDGEEIKTIEIIIDGNKFYSENEMNEYIKENEAYVEKEITINVTNSLGNITTKTQTVTFRTITGPVIKNLPSTIITNVTQLSDSYVSYDKLGKKEEIYTIVETSTDYTSAIALVEYADEWLTENNEYEVDVNIKIKATGNNDLASEVTQAVKFIRGISVTNENELNTALATNSPLYIYVANNIACSNTISVDGVTHTLDLNNKEISYTLSSTDEEATYTFITMGSTCNLTIIDSTSQKQGRIVGKISEEKESDGINREAKIITVNNKGTLNMESGTIASEVSRKITAAKKGVGVHDTCIAVQNSGIVNLNGGNISSNASTQACIYLSVQISEARATGIVNTGTVNATTGSIKVNSDAYAVRSRGATVWGKTYAYSYGIENSGTINGSDNITFTTTVRAHQTDTYSTDEDSANIKTV